MPPHALAPVFARRLRAELGDSVLAEIDERNKTAPEGVCASHDFCDANMVMFHAWREVFGSEEVDAEIWSAAWDIVTESGFTVFALAEDLDMRLTHNGGFLFTFTREFDNGAVVMWGGCEDFSGIPSLRDGGGAVAFRDPEDSCDQTLGEFSYTRLDLVEMRAQLERLFAIAEESK